MKSKASNKIFHLIVINIKFCEPISLIMLLVILTIVGNNISHLGYTSSGTLVKLSHCGMERSRADIFSPGKFEPSRPIVIKGTGYPAGLHGRAKAFTDGVWH